MARSAIERAPALDAESAEARGSDAGFRFRLGWDYTGAVASARRAIALNSNPALAHFYLAHTLSNSGEHTEALECCSNARMSSGGNTEALSIAGHVHAASGERAEAEQKIHEFLARRREHYVPPYNVALVFAGLGDLDSALHWLQLAFADRDVHMNFLRDHKWNVLRSRPEFRALLKRVGLPE